MNESSSLICGGSGAGKTTLLLDAAVRFLQESRAPLEDARRCLILTARAEETESLRDLLYLRLAADAVESGRMHDACCVSACHLVEIRSADTLRALPDFPLILADDIDLYAPELLAQLRQSGAVRMMTASHAPEGIDLPRVQLRVCHRTDPMLRERIDAIFPEKLDDDPARACNQGYPAAKYFRLIEASGDAALPHLLEEELRRLERRRVFEGSGRCAVAVQTREQLMPLYRRLCGRYPVALPGQKALHTPAGQALMRLLDARLFPQELCRLYGLFSAFDRTPPPSAVLTRALSDADSALAPAYIHARLDLLCDQKDALRTLSIGTLIDRLPFPDALREEMRVLAAASGTGGCPDSVASMQENLRALPSIFLPKDAILLTTGENPVECDYLLLPFCAAQPFADAAESDRQLRALLRRTARSLSAILLPDCADGSWQSRLKEAHI